MDLQSSRNNYPQSHYLRPTPQCNSYHPHLHHVLDDSYKITRDRDELCRSMPCVHQLGFERFKKVMTINCPNYLSSIPQLFCQNAAVVANSCMSAQKYRIRCMKQLLNGRINCFHSFERCEAEVTAKFWPNPPLNVVNGMVSPLKVYYEQPQDPKFEKLRHIWD